MLGQVAYEAWGKSMDESWGDFELHSWDGLSQDDQAPFHAAATAVRDAVITELDPKSFREAGEQRYPVLTAAQAGEQTTNNNHTP